MQILYNIKHDNTSLVSSLIYKFDCNKCNSIYVGKTTRHLAVRISKHMGVSYRTLLPLSSSPFSAIRKHVNISDHENYSIMPEQFKIIARDQNDFELLIKESLLSNT